VTIGDAVKLVARLGGHLDRKDDLPPGHQVMWNGYAALQLICLGFTLQEYG